MRSTHKCHNWSTLMTLYYLIFVGKAIRRQTPAPRPQEYYRVYENITDCKGPLIFLPLPHDYYFVVTSSVIKMLNARGLFSGITSEDTHAHMAKVRSMCNSFVGRPKLNMNVVGLRVFPLSLT